MRVRTIRWHDDWDGTIDPANLDSVRHRLAASAAVRRYGASIINGATGNVWHISHPGFMPGSRRMTRGQIEAVMDDDLTWLMIVEVIGERAIAEYIAEQAVEEDDETEPKTWDEIGKELKPEILGWNWAA